MVSYYYTPDYSGSAVQARNLSRHLKGLGIDATIVAANLSNSPADEAIGGLRVRRLRVVRNRHLGFVPFWAALFWFLVRHGREFDIIHAHGVLPHVSASLAGAIIGRPTILKVAMAESDLAFHCHGRLLGAINRFLVKRFDRYIATTDAIAEEFASQRLDVSRVCRIPNGVDTEVYAPLDATARAAVRRELGLPDGPVVLFVGILNRRKNVDGLLRIWRSAVVAGAPGHLAIVGPLPDDDEAFRQTLRISCGAPELAGRVSMVGYRENVVAYMQASDVFVLPSKREGMANVVLEAMACGLPPLVSRAAGVSAVIADGRNGFSLPIEDEEGFARIVHGLLTNPARTAQLGGEARKTVEARFALSAVATTYARLYDELLAPAGHR
jgi:glycosyltransferase involved in cell wall biosynthesis